MQDTVSFSARGAAETHRVACEGGGRTGSSPLVLHAVLSSFQAMTYDTTSPVGGAMCATAILQHRAEYWTSDDHLCTRALGQWIATD